MGRVILAVFMSGLVTAAGASPPVAAQVGEPVLIRNGFVVAPGKGLLVDDMSGRSARDPASAERAQHRSRPHDESGLGLCDTPFVLKLDFDDRAGPS